MTNPTKDVTSKSNLTIGLDLGDRFSLFVAIDSGGEEVVQEGRVRTTPEALRRQFQSMAPTRIAIEVGAQSPWVSRLLTELGYEVLVANPRKLRLIYENDSKSDRVDAYYRARVARLDPALLSPIRHRSLEAQADLAVLRAREQLVNARTQLVNHVRGAVKAVGTRIGACSTPTFATQVRKAKLVPEVLAPALGPILETIDERADGTNPRV